MVDQQLMHHWKLFSASINDNVQSFAHPRFIRDGMDLASVTRTLAKGAKISKGVRIQELKVIANDSTKRLCLMQKRNQQLERKCTNLMAKNQALMGLLTDQNVRNNKPIQHRRESPLSWRFLDNIADTNAGVPNVHPEVDHEPSQLFSFGKKQSLTDFETKWWTNKV